MADESNAAAPQPPKERGCPLQLVQLNMEERKVEVNEDALGRLEKRLREIGTHKVAVVSVMGAFRTGKSFLLDLMLRHLRYDAENPDHEEEAPVPRGGEEEFKIPAWLTAAGAELEGAKEDEVDGFRFRGGMDACTEGIWVWSEPFIRKIKGEKVALLLMDTQGAWDSNMTKEQSATIFGLTAVLSSKQIYNINMQIQEDKVENLAYFMRFAQAALRKAGAEVNKEEEADRPFQCLDFLVRDWRHFRDDWTVAQCEEQMDQHLSKHVNPNKVVENSTAEALQSMFQRVGCYCLPHPGLAIEKETWSGSVKDISPDFLRFADSYVKQVFTEGLATKSILGSELSTITFPLILRDFTNAFHDAAPAAMSFTQAMTNCTVLLAKEQAMKSYAKRMDEIATQNKRGMDPEKFEDEHRNVTKAIQEEYKRITIFGSDDTRADAWVAIMENLAVLHQRYLQDNERRLEKALVAFANIALLGVSLFALDRASDWTCDWWSQTCTDLSKLMLLGYMSIFAYIGVHVYLLFNEKGRMAAGVAGAELWKEMVRLIGVYGEIVQGMSFADVQEMVKKAIEGVTQPKEAEAEADKKGK